jgi:hypothetical protein
MRYLVQEGIAQHVRTAHNNTQHSTTTRQPSGSTWRPNTDLKDRDSLVELVEIVEAQRAQVLLHRHLFKNKARIRPQLKPET